MSTQVRVRIAPSPTGHLHVGTARTALYNYLFARRHGGAFVFRLEDTDEVRSSEAYTKDIIDGLKWLGLNWDEGPDIGGPYAPYRQTEKIDRYSHFAEKLIASGKAYFCYCSQEELTAMKEEQKTSGDASRYDNRCRNLTSEQHEKYQLQGRAPAIRFMVEEPRVVTWPDGIKGEIGIDTADLGGDMVIVKSTGVATYNFAVVVDDIDMKITDVIRGEDHIHNTAKQILLYEALGMPVPNFAHPALIFDTERRKLSKRHHGEAVHVDRYRKDGYLPEAIINYLAQMSFAPPDGEEIFDLEKACRLFDLSRVSKSPAIFDTARLNWFNGQYIRKLPIEKLVELSRPYVQIFALDSYGTEQIAEITASVKDGLTLLSDITDAVRFFFEEDIRIPQDICQSVLGKEQAHVVLEKLKASCASLPYGDHAGLKAQVDAIGKDLGVKGKDLYWPIRAALSGKTQGPDLGAILSILGKERIAARLDKAIELCRQYQTA